MALELYVTSSGRFGVRAHAPENLPALSAAAASRIERAFREGPGAGLLHLATDEGRTELPPPLAYAREFAQRYFTLVCHLPDDEGLPANGLVEPPADDELSGFALEAPPMTGLEYLDAGALRRCWLDLDERVRSEVAQSRHGLRAWLHEKNPVWRLVGRVTFHLAENRRDEECPFAFLATYASSVSARGEARHVPLAHALREYAGAANRKRLVALLTPVRDAGERLPWVRSLIDSGDVYQPLAWTANEAHRFLRDVPALESSGLAVRIPDWWKTARPPRPQVSVRVGDTERSVLGAESLLDFSVELSLDGDPLSERETNELLAATSGLIRLRGRWVEVDSEKLSAALAHWKRVEQSARDGRISFYEGMRLLAGVDEPDRDAGDELAAAALHEWSGVEAGEGLRAVLARMRDPDQERFAAPAGLDATLRPYQVTGVKWLALLDRLGLGACLADDMGLGKTIQVLALLLHLRASDDRDAHSASTSPRRHEPRPAPPSLIVAPASLIANWKAEIDRFAPGLVAFLAHPSETDVDFADAAALETATAGADVVITTYGLVMRTDSLRQKRWRSVVLDEAQAIKNPGARQTRAVKQLESMSRVALTGTPVENRLSDLWSLFDFLNPGLLGSARQFSRGAKELASGTAHSYAPLRRLVQPYILRRLKTDKRIIDDLPEKTEVRAFCGLTPEQAALYQRCIEALAAAIGRSDGIQRRGLVLSHLMQLKQICNHPAQWQGGADYDDKRSGKFERLASLCEELAERQQRVLVFTQFREIVEPLVAHLTRVFGRRGLALHGGTPVGKRRALVAEFQRDDGPPFFVLSLKAGGTGLNLTAASHVVHFDRWWNPAVENQATDRAFRIGQRRNVVVHKFVCRGTVEEKIDALIESKRSLSRELLDVDGGQLLTEMDDEELMRVVALDIHKARDAREDLR